MAMKTLDIYSLVTKNKLLDKKYSVKNSVFPNASSVFLKQIVKENDPLFQVKKKFLKEDDSQLEIKKLNTNCFSRLEDKVKSRNLSEFSLSSFNQSISTDNHSTNKDKKFNLFEKREKSRFNFVDPKNEMNDIPQFISEYISIKAASYFLMRNVKLEIYDYIFYKREGFKDWKEIAKLNEISEHI